MTKSARHGSDIDPATVAELLAMRAERQPGRVGYTFVSDSGAEDITYSELDRRARGIAGMLHDLGLPGERVVLLCPPGPDYLTAFFGCMYAGVIAVPACPPDPLRPGRVLPRLAAIMADATPSAMLTTPAIGSALPVLFRSAPELARLRTVTIGDAPAASPPAWEPALADAESVALLQYTSGSTSAPKGVVITHRNLISNSELISRFLRHSQGSRGMTWLPPYHDMGLIGGILQPLYVGFPVTLMSPADFLRRPLTWLEEMSRTRATTSAAPNFAYDLCVRKTTEAERARLDLSSWRVAVNSSEPVRAETMENFAQAFEPTGFRPEAFHPCYGLAEATLIVTGGLPWSRHGIKSFDAVTLGYGTAIQGTAEAKSRRLVSCGFLPRDSRVVIADPVSHEERAAGQIGEIWISGDGVAQSYWHRPRETTEVFGARLADTGERPFLRSGDLGFMLGRQLFVMGRIKDLIIIRGRNHYPQDIELIAERSSPLLRPGCSAAFTVPDGDRERLVIAHEITGQLGGVDVGGVADAIRAAVAEEHEIGIHTVVLVPRGGIPKTSSGKVQRRLCAAMFAAGQLAEVGRSEAGDPGEAGDLRLDRSSLLSAPPTERRSLLREYLSGLIAVACGVAVTKVATDVPLLALGIDSYAAIGIQQSIRVDLGVHVTASDLAYAISVADLAARLDVQLGPGSAPAQAGEALAAPRPGSADADADEREDLVRHYRWVSGSRVPDHAALSPDGFLGDRRMMQPRGEPHESRPGPRGAAQVSKVAYRLPPGTQSRGTLGGIELHRSPALS